jgi:hypothetical protein
VTRAWLLNLDAEDEVDPTRRQSDPLAAVARRPALVEQLRGLVPAGEAVIDREGPASLAGVRVLTWCPTPAARALVAKRGGRLDGPGIEVLRRTLSRALSASIGLSLEASSFVDDPDGAVTKILGVSPTGAWLARRAYGFAGRGRRVIGSAPNDLDRAFVVRAAREGGVLVEPLVERAADFGMHGYVDERGLVLGDPTSTRVDAAGVWRSTERAAHDELSRGERDALRGEIERAARALLDAGHRGPFGIDAYRYRLGGELRFNPRCEVNARYSMGWAVGMGDRRPDLDKGTPSIV